MSEQESHSETGEKTIRNDLFPISIDIARDMQTEFIPELMRSPLSWMDHKYLDTLSGGPIKSGEPDLMEAVMEVAHGISLENQRADQSTNHQVALVTRIGEEEDGYSSQDPANGRSQAMFYRYGSIIMYEGLNRMAEGKGLTLPILSAATIKKAHNQYLQPDRYKYLVQERDETVQDLLDPKTGLLIALLEGEDTSIKMLTDRITAVTMISLNKFVKDFPKVEPHIYRAISQSGLLRHTRRIEKESSKYKKALFKGAIDIRLCFQEAEKEGRETITF